MHVVCGQNRFGLFRFHPLTIKTILNSFLIVFMTSVVEWGPTLPFWSAFLCLHSVVRVRPLAVTNIFSPNHPSVWASLFRSRPSPDLETPPPSDDLQKLTEQRQYRSIPDIAYQPMARRDPASKRALLNHIISLFYHKHGSSKTY